MDDRDDQSLFSQLIQLSRRIGQPENDYIIQAEGNTSVRLDEHSFWIKASGTSLHNITPAGFVAMKIEPLLELLDRPAVSEAELKACFEAARVDPSVKLRPSIEVVLHAIALTVGRAKFVVHTHPSAWNAILCSVKAEEATRGRIFPDQVVLCGPAPMFVKYTDPGLPLALEVHRQFLQYIDKYGDAPKEILLQNHGLIALGNSATEAENVTLMSVKAARILGQTYALGGPNFLSESDVMHLWRRPDEIERRAKLS
jgi:rhamnose utilization protein RhaD (predicted bifunctional aldolase and dehydrogenase)